MQSQLHYKLAFFLLTIPIYTTRAFPSERRADTAAICGVTYDDPAKAWRDSGAGRFLDNWIHTHGEKDWAYNMDMETTDGGTQGSGVLNCISFDTGNCNAPTHLCKEFTPPELWHVRKAMANAYQMTKTVFNNFEISVLKEHLKAATIINDFGPGSGSVNMLGLLNGVYTIAAGAMAFAVPIAAPITIVAGIFGAAASAPSAGTIDLAAEIDSQLSSALEGVEQQTRSMLNLVFAGAGDTSKLPGADKAGIDNEQENIAKFFSGGKFLFDVTPEKSAEKAMQSVIDKGALLLRQRLVTIVLRAQNYYIWKNTDAKQAASCSGASARLIDGACYQLHHFDKGQSKAIDDSKINKFEDTKSGYEMSVEWFYRYSEACQKAKGFDGDMDGSEFPAKGDIPTCFFNIPVIEVAGSVCDAGKLPDRLGIKCDRPESCQPDPKICR